MKKILLINAEGMQAICMARSLRKQGYRVIGSCNYKMKSGYATRWLSEKYISLYITLQNEAVFDYLINDHYVDVTIPLADEVLDIPFYYDISEKELNKVINVVNSIN